MRIVYLIVTLVGVLSFATVRIGSEIAFPKSARAETRCSRVTVEVYHSSADWPAEEICAYNRIDGSTIGVGEGQGENGNDYINAFSAAVSNADGNISPGYVSCSSNPMMVSERSWEIIDCP